MPRRTDVAQVVPRSLGVSALRILERVVAAGVSHMTKVIASAPFSHVKRAYRWPCC